MIILLGLALRCLLPIAYGVSHKPEMFLDGAVLIENFADCIRCLQAVLIMWYKFYLFCRIRSYSQARCMGDLLLLKDPTS